MLEQLELKNNKWLKYALYLTKNKDDANDLVQDMYLNLADCKKQINDFFVLTTIRNMFYNNMKRKKYEFTGYDFSYTSDNANTFEPNDYEQSILNHIKANVSWWEEELLEMKYHHSYRELEEMYNINHVFVYRTIKDIKDELNTKLHG